MENKMPVYEIVHPKKPNIKEFLFNIQQVMEMRGEFSLQVFVIYKEGGLWKHITLCLPYSEDKAESSRLFLKSLVESKGSSWYLVANECYYKRYTPKDVPIKPSLSPDSREALGIAEFRKGYKNKTYLFPFFKDMGEVVWGDMEVLEGFDTIWNVFFEEEGMREKVKQNLKGLDEFFGGKINGR